MRVFVNKLKTRNLNLNLFVLLGVLSPEEMDVSVELQRAPEFTFCSRCDVILSQVGGVDS